MRELKRELRRKNCVQMYLPRSSDVGIRVISQLNQNFTLAKEYYIALAKRYIFELVKYIWKIDNVKYLVKSLYKNEYVQLVRVRVRTVNVCF